MEEVKVVVVKRSELGTNCWKPLRFFERCWRCDRYWRCKYPEKVVNEEYEQLMKAKVDAMKKLNDFRIKNR